jgi:hypothetical protein
MHRGREAAA